MAGGGGRDGVGRSGTGGGGGVGKIGGTRKEEELAVKGGRYRGGGRLSRSFSSWSRASPAVWAIYKGCIA